MGGHYDRGDPSPDSDIWVECFCVDCKQHPSFGLPGKRILCRHFEAHGGELIDALCLEISLCFDAFSSELCTSIHEADIPQATSINAFTC